MYQSVHGRVRSISRQLRCLEKVSLFESRNIGMRNGSLGNILPVRRSATGPVGDRSSYLPAGRGSYILFVLMIS
jgi:hypothetical protein